MNRFTFKLSRKWEFFSLHGHWWSFGLAKLCTFYYYWFSSITMSDRITIRYKGNVYMGLWDYKFRQFLDVLSRDICGPKKGRLMIPIGNFLGTFTSDTAGELDVLWHDGDTLGVDRAQVGVLEKADQISFACLLESQHGGALETQISLEVLCDFTYKSLEWQFPDEELSALLVPSDFTEGDGTRPVSVRFLNSTSGWCTFTCGLGGQLLSRGLATG